MIKTNHSSKRFSVSTQYKQELPGGAKVAELVHQAGTAANRAGSVL